MSIKMPKGINRDLTYYLGGPMSGIPEYNYPAFERTYLSLTESGLVIQSPHTNSWPNDDVLEEELWKYMMKAAIQQLMLSDGIILMSGWTVSRGAVLEANIASALQMPMYFLDNEYLVAMHRTE